MTDNIASGPNCWNPKLPVLFLMRLNWSAEFIPRGYAKMFRAE
jgi:hypothetical protein